MNVVSLFTGIGGFDLAYQRSGATVTMQVEIDPYARQVLTSRFAHVELRDDVRNIGRVGADLVCGGFPCQDISTAGRHAGLAGSRSGLWYEFARILEESLPQWCLIENVSNLLSSNGGRDFGSILGTLADLGYGFAYRMLDSQFFGVPQRRRRVFIVGCIGDERRAAEVLLEPEGGCWNPPSRTEATKIPAALTRSGLGGGGPDDNLAQAGHLIVSPLTAKGPRAHDDNSMFQLVHHDGVRKLMPVECERLQGFPDGWTEGPSDTQRYRLLGNAVTVNVVEWIAQRMVAA